MKFLVQHNLMNIEQLEKIRVATEGYPREFVGLIPFSHDFISDEPIEGTDYIPYGSTLMTTLALDRKWKGLHFNHETFSMKLALTKRPDMMNKDVVMTVEEAEIYLRNVDRDIFVRPDLDLKHFSGQVINSFECANWFKDAMSFGPESGSYAMDPQMDVIISHPKKIQAEFRWFVVDRKVVSGSMYRAHGQQRLERCLDKAMIREAQKFANGWLPDDTCVMDLALVDGKVEVIEFNCINSSGLYDNDVSAVFKSLWELHTK